MWRFVFVVCFLAGLLDIAHPALVFQRMNGRFFAGRKLEAEIYDGKTKYTSNVTSEDAEKEEAERLEKFAKWLESKE